MERRVERYQGKRPIGLYRWDLECLLDTLSLEMTDRPLHPRLRRIDLTALQSLYDRLRKEYDLAYGAQRPSNWRGWDYLGGIAAESLLGITDQRVEVDVFDGLTVSVVL